MSKPLTKSKTFWANLLIVVAGALGGIMGTDVITNNPQLLAYFGAAAGFINILLRFFTKTSIEGIK